MSELVPVRKRDRQQAQRGRRTTWLLRAESDWLVEGQPEDLNAVQDALPRLVVDRLARGLVRLTFGNSVGRYEAGPLGTLEVVTGKWGEEDFDRLLARITDVAVGLPFSAGGAGALPYERVSTVSEEVAYQTYMYLRHAIGVSESSRRESLVGAVRSVLARPQRKNVRATQVTPIELARRVEPASLVAVVCGQWPLRRHESGPLARHLRGMLPTHIGDSIVMHDVDTAENRFVKAVLALCRRVVEHTRALMTDGALPGIERDLRVIEAALRPLDRARLWQDVGDMVHFPSGSSVLHGRADYRAILQHYNKLRMGSRLPLSERETQRLLEIRDIATLYELWSCFAVIEAVATCLGPPTRVELVRGSARQLHVCRGLRAGWDGGVEVHYNRRFTPNAKRWRSTSLPLRPDVSLVTPAGPNAGIHVFDAKFRVDHRGELRGDYFKSDDIAKMHTYVDALPDVLSAWVLFPGDVARCFPRDGSTVSDLALFPVTLRGVGALPLPAGEVGPALQGVIARLLA